MIGAKGASDTADAATPGVVAAEARVDAIEQQTTLPSALPAGGRNAHQALTPQA